MRKSGPIIVIEDDVEDQEFLMDTFKTLNYANTVLYFTDGHEALEFIQRAGIEPFLIISDINMPTIDGFEIRKQIQCSVHLKNKFIPYLFFSTGLQRKEVDYAYALSAQGFFVKPNTTDKLKKTIKTIIDYWQACSAPGEYSL
jgi:CheY-like chemotaxis protein